MRLGLAHVNMRQLSRPAPLAAAARAAEAAGTRGLRAKSPGAYMNRSSLALAALKIRFAALRSG
jgi:hypothetical protein